MIEKMQPGVTCGEVIGAVMQFLDGKGYAQYAVPIFGHGIGVAGDEFYPPVMAVPPWNEMVLQPNMVEEAYLQLNVPGVGGFRLEAPLLIAEKGNELLCKVSWEPRRIACD
ncbi:MAG: M24 family metallopeptidase [Bacillota bacterium]